jgi:hypothetical protein
MRANLTNLSSSRDKKYNMAIGGPVEKRGPFYEDIGRVVAQPQRTC